MTTWLVLDVSASMAFGTADRLKIDVAEGVTLAVAQIAVRRGGRLGVITAGAAAPRLLPPRGGRGAIAAARRLALDGVATDDLPSRVGLDEALTRLHRLARSRGLIVIASDLRDTGWERPLRRLTARHSAIVTEIADPREGELPDAGVITLVDPETGAQIEADTSSARLRSEFAAAEARRRGAVADAIRSAGAQHVRLSTQGDWMREMARALR